MEWPKENDWSRLQEQRQLHPFQRILSAALHRIILVRKSMRITTLLLPNTIIAMHDGLAMTCSQTLRCHNETSGLK